MTGGISTYLNSFGGLFGPHPLEKNCKHLTWNRMSGYVRMVLGLFLRFELFAVEGGLAALHLRYPFMWLGTAPMPMKDTLSICQHGRIQQCMAVSSTVAKFKPTHA